MKLQYYKQDGEKKEFELGERSITIGRSPDADIILLDEKVSRVHCGVRLWDGEFYIKDLKSKNGTFVNGRRVEVCKLKPSDTVRIGSYTFNFEQPGGTGTETALREISDEMGTGKGYSTLLKEIVKDSGDEKPARKKPEPAEKPTEPEEPDKPEASEKTEVPEKSGEEAEEKKADAPAPKPGLKKPLPQRPKFQIKIKRPNQDS